MKKLVSLFILLALSYHIYAQEIITSSYTHAELLAAKNRLTASQNKNITPRQLPFIDDFSYPGIYPIDSLWLTKSAFVNNRYALNVKSIGVATLDAINDTGGHYPSSSSFPFGADTLLSIPIRMDSLISQGKKLSPADSLFFSFYYQPQGLGNAPETDDSLVLEFYSPSLDTWFHSWSSPGMSYTDFLALYGSSFRFVMIPITDLHFFESGFQFRFTNYASLSSTSLPSFSSNVDHWHIDYVYLDHDRSANEQSINDVAFTSGPTSLLNLYQSIPWTQYLADTTALMNHDARFRYSKYEGTTEIIDLSFSIFDLVGTTGNYTSFPSIFNYGNTPPFTDTALIPRPDFSNYYFRTNQTNDGMVDFEVRAYLKANFSKNISQINDTFRFYQRFYNYIAYDDGTAEAGYGLAPAGARLAYKFTLAKPDTLKAIMMYFNQTLNNASQKYFYLTIWNDNNGIPGSIIYEKAGQRPTYENELNTFHTYPLSQPLPISGTFYVGWRQTSDDNLNLGFDRNTNTKNRIYYNVDGNWTQSLNNGSLMIRPVVGKNSSPFMAAPEQEEEMPHFSIYPNPLQDNYLHINISDPESDKTDLQLLITDISGRTILRSDYRNILELRELSAGAYIIFVLKDGQHYAKPQRFIICN